MMSLYEECGIYALNREALQLSPDEDLAGCLMQDVYDEVIKPLMGSEWAPSKAEMAQALIDMAKLVIAKEAQFLRSQ